MTVVLDASVLVRVLLQSGPGIGAVHAAVEDDDWHAPELIDLEIASALRRLTARNLLSEGDAENALALLGQAPLARYPHNPLLPRVWDLRRSMTADDAAYVALAEALEARLLTSDAKLARAPGARCRVELLT